MNIRAWSMLTVLAMIAVAGAGEFSKQPIGGAGGWSGTLAGAVLNGALYRADSAGNLTSTDRIGSQNRLGGADFAGTAFLLAMADTLVSIETDGSLYLINPADGSWKRSGPKGGWANTLAAAPLKGVLYTIESSGTLYASDPAEGTWQKKGNSDFAATAFLFAVGEHLITIEKSGTLYRVQPSDGSWKQVGDAGAWANTVAGAVVGDILYTVERDGSLYATDVQDGRRTLSSSGFDGTGFLFAWDGGLFGIDASGNFYQAVEGGGEAKPADAVATPLPPSTQEDEAKNDPARAGALTFQFMGKWVGDTAPLEKDPEFLKQKNAAPEMVQGVMDMMQGMSMTVTLDGITMTVMGETVGPFSYSVVAGHDDTLVIENNEGPKKGVRSRILFSDPRHVQIMEVTASGNAMFFKKP